MTDDACEAVRMKKVTWERFALGQVLDKGVGFQPFALGALSLFITRWQFLILVVCRGEWGWFWAGSVELRCTDLEILLGRWRQGRVRSCENKKDQTLEIFE